MGESRFNKDLIASTFIVLAVMIVTAVFGDYFFDLNDDVLMKDILSGAYLGAPEGHNIQMLYPISFILSCLYRTGTKLDWYGIFLCLCQFLCVFLIILRSMKLAGDIRRKVFLTIAEIAIFLGFFGPHFLFVQYTVVCGLISGTAAFLILTCDKLDLSSGIVPACFLVIAYQIRSEMLLLTLPMVLVAVLIKWVMLGYDKKNFISYAKLCLIVAAGLLASLLIHKIGYSSEEWKEFNRFFDNRTELYDFQYIPDYAENKEFYDSIGLSESEQQLLINYNFALDDEINADMLGTIAEYAARLRGEEQGLISKLFGSLGQYKYRLHHIAKPKSYEYPMTDYPWNVGMVVLYLFAAVSFFVTDKENKVEGQKKRFIYGLLLLVVLFACRTTLWLYIIARGRDPIRITHPLYLIEILILMGMIILNDKKGGKVMLIATAIISLIGIISLPMQGAVINRENTLRADMLDKYNALYTYFGEKPDNYYLIDVYTSVSYADTTHQETVPCSEKMFANVNNDFCNHDILGGWASKSPIYREKLEKAGFDSVEKALLADNVYLVQTIEKDTEWIRNYYLEKGTEIDLEQIDAVAGVFAIYRLEGMK